MVDPPFGIRRHLLTLLICQLRTLVMLLLFPSEGDWRLKKPVDRLEGAFGRLIGLCQRASPSVRAAVFDLPLAKTDTRVGSM